MATESKPVSDDPWVGEIEVELVDVLFGRASDGRLLLKETNVETGEVRNILVSAATVGPVYVPGSSMRGTFREYLKRLKGKPGQDTDVEVDRENVESTLDERMRAAGIAEITPENADEQFGMLLDVLDRIANTANETAREMAENRRQIDAGLEQIDRNAETIDRLIADLLADGRQRRA
jgi:CRISPR/Cas system CSM-associated protein Csm3 (group 7 of RAMP superfamily)